MWSGIIVPWHKIENVKNGQSGSVGLKSSKASLLANLKKKQSVQLNCLRDFCIMNLTWEGEEIHKKAASLGR